MAVRGLGMMFSEADKFHGKESNKNVDSSKQQVLNIQSFRTYMYLEMFWRGH